MRYRERVAIHAPARTESATGQVLEEFAVVRGLESVPASIVTHVRDRLGQEANLATMTVVEETFDIVLGGHHPGITTLMRVVAAGGHWFDILTVAPTLAHSATVLLCRRLDPAGTT